MKKICLLLILIAVICVSPLRHLFWPGPQVEAEDFTITLVEPFEIRAKVLSTRRYRYDFEASISPVDLALGWGRMMEDEVLQAIRVTQSNRWYRWRCKEYPIPKREIEQSSANMHMIPANPEIKTALLDLDSGEVIQLTGYLANVATEEGWRWTSSRTRNDTGNGACEVVYVTALIRE